MHQLILRHLDESQRAKVAAKLANLTQGGDRKSVQAANLPVDSISQSRAAELLNVGTRTVAAASKVERESPEVFAQITPLPQRLQRSPAIANRRHYGSLPLRVYGIKWEPEFHFSHTPE